MNWSLGSKSEPSLPSNFGSARNSKIPFYRGDHSPVPYDGLPERGQGGIRALLEGMRTKLGWAPVNDGARIIGLYDKKEAPRSRLNPAGSSNFPARPSNSLHQTKIELDEHLSSLAAIAAPHGIGFLALGIAEMRLTKRR